MKKLFRGIKSFFVILEIAGALISAILFILNKIGILKKINNKQSPPLKKRT